MKPTPKTKKDLINIRKDLRYLITFMKEVSPELEEVTIQNGSFMETASTTLDLIITKMEDHDKRLDLIINKLKTKGL